MKIKYVTLFSLCAIALLSLGYNNKPDYDIIIYGGGPQAVATALKASSVTNDKARILMIVPEPVLGSIITHGKQNLFDVNYYKPSKLPEGLNPNYLGAQAGSMYYFLNDMGAVFQPDAMAEYLEQKIHGHKNITLSLDSDIREVQTNKESIRSVKTGTLTKDDAGIPIYKGDQSPWMTADTFVDASESGKLTRLSGVHHTVGREDQGHDQTQMVATLMYKIKGVDFRTAIKTDLKSYGLARSPQGLLQFWAGNEAYSIPDLANYGNSNHSYRIKGYNAGQAMANQGKMEEKDIEFWMNQFLIYNVDSRKALRDQGSNVYPASSGTLDPDSVRLDAMKEIDKPSFIQMIRQLPGFANAQLVTENGKPAVGSMLYIRETIHTDRGANQFGLNKDDVVAGGDNHYDRRIGLGYYQFDSNTYVKGEHLTQPRAKQPWYVPYEVLVPKEVNNLLIPGYAASIDSFAWTAMRVYPNLIMLGDAAGVTAGLAFEDKVSIINPSSDQMKLIQDELRKAKAILEK